MTTNKLDSQEVLRVINDAGADAPHTADESREALADAGIDADELARAIRDDVRLYLRAREHDRAPWEAIRSLAFALTAVSVAVFVVWFSITYHAEIAARHEATRASLIGPLLPGLSSDDASRRSVALAVAQEVDPAFAAATAERLRQWEAVSLAQARANRNSVYQPRILAGVLKLEFSRDPDDRKVAIWSDLLPVLVEARRNRDDFVDVAIEYQRVLPLLRVRNPDVFLDSYWGELWILNILLESKIAPVVEAARQQAPEPAVVERIYQMHAPSLPDRDRKAFEEAVTVYTNTVKALR
jgi:hypothetical protein